MSDSIAAVKDRVYIRRTPSTNDLLWKMIREQQLQHGFVLYTDFQSSGKGQQGNTWESEAGKNLLFSMAFFPKELSCENQFIISQMVSVSIVLVLQNIDPGFRIKWPNDIYWNDKKVGGILIENSLQGSMVKSVVIGVGLNVNQQLFTSNAPNPISLFNITGHRYQRKRLMDTIVWNILNYYKSVEFRLIREIYSRNLYRAEGFYQFKDKYGVFNAKINAVHTDGQLELETPDGMQKYYYFKEVQFLIP